MLLRMPAVTFDTLWKNHPALQSPPVIEPCTTGGRSNHVNQCVIRMGVCLTNSGVSLVSFRGAFCWSGHGKTHPLRAEEFKLWLNSNDAPFVGSAVISKMSPSALQKSHHAYIGQRGIVVFRNFWGAGNNGDHIDLWNGTRIAQGELDYFARSKEIWFWAM